MGDVPIVDLRSEEEWRAWLRANHAASAGVWLVFHKPHTGIRSIGYEDSVCQALCFGWIDSLIKRLDDDRYARKFTPRKPDSRWSASNRRRWTALSAAGQLEPAGLAASPAGRPDAAPPPIPTLPPYIARALRRTPRAWRTFQDLPPGQRRRFVAWIHLARRPETRAKRLREAVALLTAGKTLGLK